jgi:hypothetical protein
MPENEDWHGGDSLVVTADPTTRVGATKDAVKVDIKLELVMDPERLRCINSKEGITTTITVIT